MGLPADIGGRTSLEAVLFAVDFDNAPRRQTAEIRHVEAGGDLPADMRAFHRQAVARVPPEPLFRLGRCATESFFALVGARAAMKVFGGSFHGMAGWSQTASVLSIRQGLQAMQRAP